MNILWGVRTEASPQPRLAARNDFLIHLGALIFFSLVTLIIAFPIVANFTDYLAAPVGRAPHAYLEEASQFIWYDWWVDQSLLARHVSPATTGYIFAPVGINLASQDNSRFSALVALPVTATLGAVAGFNFSLFVGTILTGYGTFLLARYLLKQNTAALIAGLAIAAAPSRLAEAYVGHPNIANAEWIPFFFLAFLKTLRGEGRWSPVLAGLTLFLVGLTGYELLVMTGLAAVVILAYEFWIDRQLLHRSARGLIVLATVFLILFVPVSFPALATIRSDTLPRPSLAQDITYSVRPQMFFNPVWNRRDFDGDVIFGRSPAFVGWVIGVLGIIAIARSRDRDWQRWGVLALVFAVLTLGPELKLSPTGPVRFTLVGRHLGIPLPFMVVRLLPLMNEFRTPERLAVIVFLALALLAGYGARQLLADVAERFPSSSRLGNVFQIAIPILLCVALVGEGLAISVPAEAVPPTTAYQVIARDPGNPVVLNLPLGFTSGTEWFGPRYGLGGDAMYFATTHGKRVITGLMPRVPTRTLDYFRSFPVLRYLVDPFHQTPGNGASDPVQVARQLQQLQVGYIAIDRTAYTPTQLSQLENYLTHAMTLRQVGQDSETIIYQVGN